MKRRHAIQAILGTPVLTVLPQPALAAPPPPQSAPAADEMPRLATATGDAVADAAPRFFSPPQMAALQKLGDLIVPSNASRPGASQASAAGFLDFLISQSPPDRQHLYVNGLDRLQAEAQRRFGKGFGEVATAQADAILAPLRDAWTYDAPSDPLAGFLRAVKEDLIAATFNSREYAAAQEAAGRRAVGMGTYWYPIE